MTYSARNKKDDAHRLYLACTDKKTVERVCRVIEQKIKRGKR